MLDSIIGHLPEHYGNVTTNFQNMPIATNIGIVLPAFSRKKFLIKTLESLRKSSLPKDCMLVIVDETMAAKQPVCKQFEYFENIDFEGGDITQINLEFDEVLREAERSDSCVACNEAGWLKHSLANPRQIQNSRFGTYIKKSFLQKNPTFHQQLSQRVQTCKTQIDEETVDLIEAFEMDIPIIKIYKNQHKNMFDSLRTGFDLLHDLFRVRYLVNIDSDTIHTVSWLTTLLHAYVELHHKLSNGPLVLSGFNADTKKNLSVQDSYVVKSDLGGINLFFDAHTYTHYVRDTLVHVGWDIQLSKIIRNHNGSLIALYTSVVQHIGTEGMWSSHESLDHSSTFHSSTSALGDGVKQLLTIFKRIVRL
jgi:hypothetical protein